MSRDRVLTDAPWVLLERLLPSSKGKQSRPLRDHRQVIEDIVFRLRTGCPWRNLPERFGSWHTVWKRHARFSKDDTWDQVMVALLTRADQAEFVDWQLSIDCTINRVHQHGLNMTRMLAAVLPSHTGRPLGRQETTC